MGRRPEHFADLGSGGTLRGHMRRAMHHEAESVRAFERIVRDARAAAVRTLAASLAMPATDVTCALGLPTGAAAAHLLAAVTCGGRPVTRRR